MDENREKILTESNHILSKLQLLSVFFENEVIYRIYLQSQVVHKLFESNTELDINKLQLFHQQYTESIIELIKRVKKNNEKNVILISDEIQINKDLIDNLNSSLHSEKDFNIEKSKQDTKVELSLKKVYRVLSDDSSEYPFSNDMSIFSSRFSDYFFHTISSELFNELIQYDIVEFYNNPFVIIQKKLLGVLLRNDFKFEFWNGFKTGKVCLEVYKISTIDRYFIFLPSGNLFLFCDISKFSEVDVSNNPSKNAIITKELFNKNIMMESQAEEIKTFLPIELINLFSEYYDKISNVDFLQNICNFDVEANILKAMLNTNSL